MAEEEHMHEQLAKLAARVAKGSMKKELDAAMKTLFQKYAAIYALENDFIDNGRQVKTDTSLLETCTDSTYMV